MELTPDEAKLFEELLKTRLEFQQISPKWYQFIMSGNDAYKKAFKLDITRADADPVGEAHGFKRNYGYCMECQVLSNAFGHYYAEHITDPNAEITIDPEILERFVQHWNQRIEHKKITAYNIIINERNKK